MTSILYDPTTSANARVTIQQNLTEYDISEWVTSVVLTPNVTVHSQRTLLNGYHLRTAKVCEPLTGEITVVVTPGDYDSPDNISAIGRSAYPMLMYLAMKNYAPLFGVYLWVYHNDNGTPGLGRYRVLLSDVAQPVIEISGGIHIATFSFVAARYTYTHTSPYYSFSQSVIGTGTVTPADTPELLADSVIAVEATPGTGWRFDEWGGDLSGSVNPTTLLMDSNKSVTATFIKQVSVALTITGGPGQILLEATGGYPDQIITSSTAVEYDTGTSVTFTASGLAGASFVGWSDDLTGTTNPQIILLLTDVSITATFSNI